MIKRIYNKIIIKLFSPNRVAKRLGVQFGKNCQFGTKNFGSEPYLIKIGDDFYSSGNVQFITHDGSVNVLRNLYEEHKNSDYFQPIIIGDNVFIGYGAIILPGTKIGNNVIVAAGSVVKGKLSDNSIYAGIPAKYICSVEDYRNKNRDKFINTKHLNPEEKKRHVSRWLIKNYAEFKGS